MQRVSNRVFNTTAQQNEIDTLKQEVERLRRIRTLSSENMIAGGWTPVNDEWAYASWTSGTRIGTITVPADATERYTAGMRIYFEQPTNGIKMAIIVLVTSTLLTVFLKEDMVLDNEGFESIYYSTHKIPLNFNADPDQWTLETISTTTRSGITSTTFVTATDSLAVGPGNWEITLSCHVSCVLGANVNRNAEVTLSTTTTTETDTELSGGTGIGSTSGLDSFGSVFTRKHVFLASAVTYTLLGRVNGSSAECVIYRDAISPTIIRATCAYL